MTFQVEIAGFNRDTGGRITVVLKQPGSGNLPFSLTLTQDQADEIWKTGRMNQPRTLVLESVKP